MSLSTLGRNTLSCSRLISQLLCSHQGTNQRGFVTFASLQKGLTEGSTSREVSWSGFSKLRQNFSNIISGGNNELKGEDKIDREHSPEAHPFTDERRGSIYVQAQWQDGGVVHDVKPHGQGISLSSGEHATQQGKKDVASA